jgi:hypothetical protein
MPRNGTSCDSAQHITFQLHLLFTDNLRTELDVSRLLSMTSQLFHFVPLWAGISERDSVPKLHKCSFGTRSEAAQVQLRNAVEKGATGRSACNQIES